MPSGIGEGAARFTLRSARGLSSPFLDNRHTGRGNRCDSNPDKHAFTMPHEAHTVARKRLPDVMRADVAESMGPKPGDYVDWLMRMRAAMVDVGRSLSCGVPPLNVLCPSNVRGPVPG